MNKGLLVAAGITLFSIISCKNNDDPDPTPGIGGTMSAQIDGTSWAATGTSYNKSASTVEFTGQRGTTGVNATAIGVQITSYSGANTYSLGNGVNVAYLAESNKLYKSATGQVTVTEDDDTWFKASFSFQGTDSLTSGTKTVSGSFTYRKK